MTHSKRGNIGNMPNLLREKRHAGANTFGIK